jgi:hypothetical protein
VSPDELAEVTGHPATSEMPQLPAPNFDHLKALTNRLGLWEHSQLASPRLEHGFCTDDNARALVVVSRQVGSDPGLNELAAIYLAFVLEARTSRGGFHNRRSTEGAWVDDVGSDDSQGRAWWALGSVARRGHEPWMRRAGIAAFDECSYFTSTHLRSNAFAILGTVDLLVTEPTHVKAMDFLNRTSQVVTNAVRARIPWPEIRLTYDNARIPEALIAAGGALSDRRMIDTGVRLLEWLLGVETDGDHFSFTPVGGWQSGEPRPGFDQQPLEAAAMAEACYRAWTITGSTVWRVRALRAAHWLFGRNDTGAVLYDEATGGTCDGLQKDSVNQNQGAESTLAGLATLQIASACLNRNPTAATT